LTDRSSTSEDPNGLLIDEAAKQWLPRLYAEWQEAWNRWRALGLGASYNHNGRGQLTNPEQHHPLLVAAMKADATLQDACRSEFAKSEWEVSGLLGVLRTRIDGDFLRDAQLNLRDRIAYGGTFKQEIMICGLRVRPAAGMRKEGDAITATTAPDALAENRSPVIQKPTYSERPKFSAEKRPDQFMNWAKSERRSGRLITQGDAQDAMEEIFGAPPIGPSGRMVIAWCRSLRAEWTAKRGTSRSRARRSNP
jgi:hypothetical protein